MKSQKLLRLTIELIGFLCFTVLAALAVKPSGGSGSSLARATFRNQLGDALLPDGKFTPCGFDYVDKTDTCTGMVDNSKGNVIPNAEQASISQISTVGLFSGQYLLRTVPNATTSMTNPSTTTWDFYVLNPSRWLVLDFSNPDGSSNPPTTKTNCQDIDQQVANAASSITNGTSGFKVTPPLVNSDSCVDNLVVRFEANNAFTSGATTSTLTIYIDEPQLLKSARGPGRVQWNELYYLAFEQPLAITPLFDGKGSIRLDTFTSDLADLHDINGNPKGTWHMPFSVTLTPSH